MKNYDSKNIYQNLRKNLILNFSVTVRTLGEIRMALGSPCEAVQDVHIRFALEPKKNWELSTNSIPHSQFQLQLLNFIIISNPQLHTQLKPFNSIFNSNPQLHPCSNVFDSL